MLELCTPAAALHASAQQKIVIDIQKLVGLAANLMQVVLAVVKHQGVPAGAAADSNSQDNTLAQPCCYQRPVLRSSTCIDVCIAAHAWL